MRQFCHFRGNRSCRPAIITGGLVLGMTLVSGQLLNAYAVASTAAADIPKWDFGSAISAVVYAGITGPVKILFAAVFGFVYAPLVITGLHHMTNAIDPTDNVLVAPADAMVSITMPDSNHAIGLRLMNGAGVLRPFEARVIAG